MEVRLNGDGLDSKGMEVRSNGGTFSLVRSNSDGGTQMETTSLIVSLCLGSDRTHSWITSQMTSSSLFHFFFITSQKSLLFLKDLSVESIR